jgi:PelA/Pel-15E family pectate lyase
MHHHHRLSALALSTRALSTYALSALLAFSLVPVSTRAAPAASPEAPISTAAFRDSAQHWYDVNPDSADRVIRPLPGRPVYKNTQVKEIADNILLFQRANGAWPKNYDMCAILTPAQVGALKATHDKNDTTIDNHTTHSQIIYLCHAYARHRDTRHRDAALRGFDFIITAQLPSGGFPQTWPAPKGYHAHITYNDGVTIGMLNLIRDIAEARPAFDWFPADRRARARAALAKGIECLLATQYTNKTGTLQGWGQQHDPVTLRPAKARRYELPSLCSVDTAEIIRFLMDLETPDPRIIRSVKAGAAWLDKTRIKGIRVEDIKNPATKRGRDKRVIPDPTAPDIWTRYYELETDRPMFATLKSEVIYDFAQVDEERRTGYAWFSTKPRGILDRTYPAWLKKHALK